uniref:Inositol-1-monophosphatase n=1 Tax=Timema genevievae TaxID=629358 RepID=A0A7R9JPN0_TIMGE|nr:unnamed protein product [Timema genevievae]
MHLVTSLGAPVVAPTNKCFTPGPRAPLSHRLIGEESVTEPVLTDAPTWIIDPIDGTTNFIHGFPLTCISIGLTVNREPVLGVVYNPILEHMFTARKGQGAFLNSRRIHVSDVTGRKRAFLNYRRIHVSDVTGKGEGFPQLQEDTHISKALVGLEVPTTQRPSTFEMRVKRGRVIEQVAREIRGLGSIVIGLCFVAMGGLDVYQYEGGIHCWDVAAASVILLEAGGVIMDPRGTDTWASRIPVYTSPTLESRGWTLRLDVETSSWSWNRKVGVANGEDYSRS